MSIAARTLDEARQNLFKPRAGVPQRPARSPDLDLRLHAPGGGSGSEALGVYDHQRIPRDSYLSDNSAAPSFFSGTSYELFNDAPKIITSKQVHVGRLQQAEVLQLGRRENALSPNGQVDAYTAQAHAQAQAQAQAQEERIHGSPGTFGVRSLTPASIRSYDTGPEESLESEVPSTTGSNDLRFSMGSLAYRDSVSTMGTGRYLARDSAAGAIGNRMLDGPRESMVSTKSNADSFLSAFPMIPPGQGGVPPVPTSSLPISTSMATLDHAAAPASASATASVARPPTSFKAPAGAKIPSQDPGSQRTSVADSFLGTFPFVPPNMDDLAELPSAALPSAAVPDTAKGEQSRR